MKTFKIYFSEMYTGKMKKVYKYASSKNEIRDWFKNVVVIGIYEVNPETKAVLR